MNNSNLKYLIISKGKELGFLDIGFSKARFLQEEENRLYNYIKKGYNEEMSFLENNLNKRLDPRLLVDGAKTVISFLHNYYPQKKQNEGSYKIAKYAYGEDYHNIIKDKLKIILNYIKEKVGNINGRYFVDTAPVLEKTWAKNSNLGWVGKNGLLITKNIGSFYNLGEIILDVEFEYDNPSNSNFCGSCTKCIDTCPTQAIESPSVINPNKCISYLTTELKNEITNKIEYKDWIFGCDVCQDICPWNKFSKPNNEERFLDKNRLLEKGKSFWEEMTEEEFKLISKKTPLKRAKYYGMRRNILKVR